MENNKKGSDFSSGLEEGVIFRGPEWGECEIGSDPSGRREWVCEGWTKNKSRVCSACADAGWTNDPQEVVRAVVNDPTLREAVYIKSPYEKEH